MNKAPRQLRFMQHDRYVLFLANVDYLPSVGGLGRYMRDEIELLRGRHVSSLCIFPFPTKRSKWLDRHLSNYWGVRMDGILVGFYGNQEILGLVAELGRAGKRLIDAQIHHLNYFNLERVARLLLDVPVPVKLFLHDYYTICPRSHLLKNGKQYCGAAMPSPEKCADCAYWTPAHHGRIRAVLTSIRERLTVVAPSPAARQIWLSTFSDFSDQTVVIPHWKEAGKIGNTYVKKMKGEPIRLAYVGAPVPYKGWEIFRKLVDELAASSLNYEFYHFGFLGKGDPSIRNIPISFIKDGREAMTQAIRKAGIDIVLLWALWPETYSYTLYESLMANVMLITNPDSGNIADTVARQNLGRIFRSDEELLAYAMDIEQVRKDIDFYRGKRNPLPAHLVPNDAIMDILDFAASPPLLAETGAIRNAWHVEALYSLKLLKKRCVGREG